MLTELSQGKVAAICDLENNLVERGSIKKINLVSGNNMEKNDFVAAARVPKINLESKGYAFCA